MKFTGWFVKVVTDVGSLELPFGACVGYKTKREAEAVAQKAMAVHGVKSAVVKKYD